ncbi:ectoine/hydroxyectoine ABC transporter permease subunit EhuC [Gandjariella thermophila]|uniref:Ectoine/hydroxyectoine ABC transporter permease subunit EhuC n=1 Tax=Gandjariella thermophila TaxID=1931992 RepID=A0A4D4JI63_9PSEU|nr:ectoine/hydroxyectoine ABC transporter permease subunit EhuC [Gandjariella thermophila]GDY33567.1 ectoine/hydroxyectoine ABC transporter permease subunit EhuC [Gandjariella thermophila]
MFDNFELFLTTLLRGAPLTVAATGGGIVLTILLSFVAGLAMLSRSRWVRFLARVYVEGWRGTSEVVQLFWIYFAVPLLVGFQLVPLWAGILVLGLNHGAYGAEIVRGAVNAVPRAQHEGAIALNLGPAQRIRKVILPQAFVEMVPPFNNLFIQLLKSSSLLSLITVTEITNQGVQVLVPNYTGQALTIFLIMLVLYLILSLVITVVMRLVERWAARVAGRPATARARVTGELGI